MVLQGRERAVGRRQSSKASGFPLAFVVGADATYDWRTLMRFVCLFLLAAAVPVAARAQSYAAKEVRFDGDAPYRKADLLTVAGLRDHGPFTKAELDAAVQRLADTGLFNGTSYKVDETALVITLAPMESAKMLPVQFSNFVWWTPQELESGLRVQVPLYAGRVPLNGDMLERLEKALVAMMEKKGIAGAKVDQVTDSAGIGGPITATTLGLTTPEVRVGTIRLAGSEATAAELERVQALLGGQEYDERSTRKALVQTAAGMYRDDGYLDATVTWGGHGEPKLVGMARYDVDLNGTLTGDALYHVSEVAAKAVAPLSQAEVDKVLQIRKGDVVFANAVRLTQNRLTNEYENRGYLDAKVTVDVRKDTAAHTAACSVTMEPGEVYRVASVATEGFSADQQKEFEHSFHVKAGDVAGLELRRAVFELNRGKAFQGSKLFLSRRRSQAQHTVALTISTKKPGMAEEK